MSFEKALEGGFSYIAWRRKEMGLDEMTISQAILDRFWQKLRDNLSVDVAIVGAGPAGLVAAYALAKKGFKTAVFERRASVGGGIWGGGMMFNEIVVQEEGKGVLDEVGVRTVPYKEGYYTADAVETASVLCSEALRAGATVFNLVSVEDVMVREGRVVGLVINWTAVQMAGLHVDPLAVRSRYVIDATGHDAEVVRVIERKGEKLLTPTGKIVGERSLWSEVAEEMTLQNTKEVYPGVFVAGMCANATFGSFRMGPIFGGMLLSGKRAAELISERLRSEG